MQLVQLSLAVSDYVCLTRGIIPKGQLSLALNSSSQVCILCSSAHCTHQVHPLTLTHTERQAVMFNKYGKGDGGGGETFHQLFLPSSLPTPNPHLGTSLEPLQVLGVAVLEACSVVKECRRGLQVERAWAWPDLRLVLKTTLMMNVSGKGGTACPDTTCIVSAR